MNNCQITVDVYAKWSEKTPAYRVYVDNDLLTERDFIWSSHSNFIRENILVNLEPGTHTVTVEHINTNGIINTKNITVNGKPSTAEFEITE